MDTDQLTLTPDEIRNTLRQRMEEIDEAFGVDGYSYVPVEHRLARAEAMISTLAGALSFTLRLIK
jgi:hypothetical protein